MKHQSFKSPFAVICLVTAIAVSCNSSSNNNPPEDNDEKFISEKKDNRWTTDFTTAQELKSLHFTIDKFTELNTTIFANVDAYQQFGDLMQMHVDRVTTYCKLDANSKNILCKKLGKIKDEVETLHGNSLEKSKEALKNIHSILAEIDSSFNYMN